MRYVISTILCTLLALISCFASANERPDPLVALGEVEQAEIAEQMWVPGTVVSRFDSRLTTEVSGVVKRIAEVGERFKKGDTILLLDDAFLQLEKQQASASIKSFDTRVTLLERQLIRLEKLGKNASLDALEAKEAELMMAKQELEQAKITFQRIALQLEKTQLVAPFDGTIVERYKQVGEFSQTNAPAVRLVSLDDLEVRANAPLSHTQFNQVGDDVFIANKEGRFSSKVRALVPVGDELSRTMEVRVSLSDRSLPIGTAVRVSLASSAKHNALTVHRDALILRQDKVYVNVVQDDLTVKQVTVTPGSGFNELIEVKGELTLGAKVAIRGSEMLRDGAKVRVKSTDNLVALR
ncbi:efflux RND transporter periplasmic adaptor subunit [Pseudoalteromonas sp.]|uniref:efflux RND transporter periplasmic adaptor subunit n=1 Tax=Pseudoalteromonas sp. TaxID=53249 RepID=UPI00356A83A2